MPGVDSLGWCARRRCDLCAAVRLCLRRGLGANAFPGFRSSKTPRSTRGYLLSPLRGFRRGGGRELPVLLNRGVGRGWKVGEALFNELLKAREG